MKILIFSKNEWSNDNSTGNTYSNFFSGIKECNIANLYLKNTKPNNEVCKNYYSVSDIDLIRSIFNSKFNPGEHFYFTKKNVCIKNTKSINAENKLYNFFRGTKNLIPILLQNLLWSTEKWNNQNLQDFIAEFTPDIIFTSTSQSIYINKILWRLKELTNAKIVLFHADDYFYDEETKRGIVSRIYYKKKIDAIKKSVEISSLNYCISHKQQVEFSKRFNKKMGLLFKGGEFKQQPLYNNHLNKSITLIYIGSLHYGRWKTLSLLASNIKEINKNDNIQFVLKIYSQYEPSQEILKNIEIDGVSKFYGKISPEKVKSTLTKSDIVLHIESFEEEEKKLTRLSFSTKIVDCLESGRTLFAIGSNSTASISYLRKNNAALIASSEEEIIETLRSIQKNKSILNEYADKGWEFGKNNHQINKIRLELYNDLKSIINEEISCESTTD